MVSAAGVFSIPEVFLSQYFLYPEIEKRFISLYIYKYGAHDVLLRPPSPRPPGPAGKRKRKRKPAWTRPGPGLEPAWTRPGPGLEPAWTRPGPGLLANQRVNGDAVDGQQASQR